jgi:hypothetical protein
MLRECHVLIDLAQAAVLSAFARSPAWHSTHAQAYGLSAETVRHRAQRSAHRNWDVYNTNSRYVGRDPDPNVRDMIARDRAEQGDSGF